MVYQLLASLIASDMEMPDALNYEAIERLVDEYDHEREMFIEHEHDGPLPEVEPEDLDDEAIERLYDEYDYEREMFMRDGDDEPLEEVEPEDLDDETIERLYDEYDHEKFMRDKVDELLKWWKLDNKNTTLASRHNW